MIVIFSLIKINILFTYILFIIMIIYNIITYHNDNNIPK